MAVMNAGARPATSGDTATGAALNGATLLGERVAMDPHAAAKLESELVVQSGISSLSTALHVCQAP